MKIPIIEEKELMETISNMQNGKATGVDGIRSELMKFIMKDKKIRIHTTKYFNNILKEPVHKDWCTPITTMIPKVKKPKNLEHRPIAVTVNSSKIFWTIIREKIEKHLQDKMIEYENQYGFTKGGKPEHCHFILQYLADRNYSESNRKKTNLYFAFIDFKKAYDSVNRKN